MLNFDLDLKFHDYFNKKIVLALYPFEVLSFKLPGNTEKGRLAP